MPKTGQPLYDPVSRAVLEPGTELVPPQADHAWRIQLHRENIADYVDIPSPEREYISAWDAFCLPRGLSSEVYLPETLMDYTRDKAEWLVSSGQRMEEFLKHLSSLQLRGVLDQGAKEAVLEILGEARGERERVERERESGDGPEPMDEDGPVDWQTARRADNCAVCAQTAASIVCVLVCSNAVSFAPSFLSGFGLTSENHSPASAATTCPAYGTTSRWIPWRISGSATTARRRGPGWGTHPSPHSVRSDSNGMCVGSHRCRGSSAGRA